MLVAIGSTVIMMLPSCVSQRAALSIQYSPTIPTINEVVEFEAAASGATIYEWNWTFGDGGTAAGQRVWHVFRSVNEEGGSIAPWKVTATAVDDRGNVSSSAEYVQVQPHTGHLATYARREVGLDCVYMDRREPEIPPLSRVLAIGDSALEEHWPLMSDETIHLLLKLYMVPTDIRRVACAWTVFSLGPDGTDWPTTIKEVDGGSWSNYVDNFGRIEEKWYYSYIGFPLELNTVADGLEPGGYLVFAEATAVEPITLDRNIYSFKILVTEPAD